MLIIIEKYLFFLVRRRRTGKKDISLYNNNHISSIFWSNVYGTCCTTCLRSKFENFNLLSFNLPNHSCSFLGLPLALEILAKDRKKIVVNRRFHLHSFDKLDVDPNTEPGISEPLSNFKISPKERKTLKRTGNEINIFRFPCFRPPLSRWRYLFGLFW